MRGEDLAIWPDQVAVDELMARPEELYFPPLLG